MSVQPLLDAAGRRRSPATMPGFRAGIAPRNKGQSYPADPPTVDEIVAVMRQAGHDRHGHRLRALIVVLWRAGLRIHEALSWTETDLDGRRGSILSRGDQHRRDHLDRPRTAPADDARQRRPRPLTGPRGSAAALPHRPPPQAERQPRLSHAGSPTRKAGGLWRSAICQRGRRRIFRAA
jgi:integrase